MLAGARDSPSFSDGEDNLAYLSGLAVRDEDRGDTSLSRTCTSTPACREPSWRPPSWRSRRAIWFQNRRYKCKRQRQDKSLEAAGQHHPPPPRRVAVPVLVRDGKPCLGGTQSYPAAAPYASNPYSYNGYPAYTYNSPAYNSNYSCTYTSIPALPPSSTPSAFMNMNLGNVSGLGGSAQAQTHQGTAVTSCQGSLQGIRA
ncbi:hypothetical protein INR49_021224, partial [Caranx melampygus]